MNYRNADKIVAIPTDMGIRVAREEIEYWTLLIVSAVEQQEKKEAQNRRAYQC